MSLDNDQGRLPDEPAAPSSAGPPEQNGVGSGSAAEPKPDTKKKSRPKNDAKKDAAALELPNGCTLSGEVNIPVTDLVITQHRDEGEKGEIRLQNLAESMKYLGQLYAAIVRFDPVTKKILIVAGNRRAKAAKFADIATLRCRIFDGPDEAIPHVIAAVENAHRAEESPWSLAQKLAAALKEGFDQKTLAEMFQKSKGAVSDMLYAVTKLPLAMRKRIEKGEPLFKVVSEHRNSKKTAPVSSTEEAAEETTAQDGPEVAETPNASELPKKAEPEATPPAAKPPVKYQYGRYEHGTLTVSISGTNKAKPSVADVSAALRHALSSYMDRPNPEQV